MTEFPQDETATCDICVRKIFVDEGVIYYSNGIPMLLCPECAEKKDEEDFA